MAKNREWNWLCVDRKDHTLHASVVLKGTNEVWLRDTAQQIDSKFRDAHDGDACSRELLIWADGIRQEAI